MNQRYLSFVDTITKFNNYIYMNLHIQAIKIDNLGAYLLKKAITKLTCLNTL